MKFSLLYELEMPKPWTATSERDCYMQALDQIRVKGIELFGPVHGEGDDALVLLDKDVLVGHVPRSSGVGAEGSAHEMIVRLRFVA